MIAADKDIICGIYPKKEINWQTVRNAMAAGVPDDQLKNHTGNFVVNLVNYEETVTVPIGEPLEIWNGGTGFMLIKREVYEGLVGKLPTYFNNVMDKFKIMTQLAPFNPSSLNSDRYIPWMGGSKKRAYGGRKRKTRCKKSSKRRCRKSSRRRRR